MLLALLNAKSWTILGQFAVRISNSDVPLPETK